VRSVALIADYRKAMLDGQSRDSGPKSAYTTALGKNAAAGNLPATCRQPAGNLPATYDLALPVS
jgi:hypothetical protein